MTVALDGHADVAAFSVADLHRLPKPVANGDHSPIADVARSCRIDRTVRLVGNAAAAAGTALIAPPFVLEHAAAPIERDATAVFKRGPQV